MTKIHYPSINLPQWHGGVFHDLLMLPEVIANTYQGVLQGVSVKETDGDWLCVVTAEIAGKKMVLFENGRCFGEAVELAVWNINTGTAGWKVSRYK